jgi:hypothetical protein
MSTLFIVTRQWCWVDQHGQQRTPTVCALIIHTLGFHYHRKKVEDALVEGM